MRPVSRRKKLDGLGARAIIPQLIEDESGASSSSSRISIEREPRRAGCGRRVPGTEPIQVWASFADLIKDLGDDLFRDGRSSSGLGSVNNHDVHPIMNFVQPVVKRSSRSLPQVSHKLRGNGNGI